jgi:hypothetical protein
MINIEHFNHDLESKAPQARAEHVGIQHRYIRFLTPSFHKNWQGRLLYNKVIRDFLLPRLRSEALLTFEIELLHHKAHQASQLQKRNTFSGTIGRTKGEGYECGGVVYELCWGLDGDRQRVLSIIFG